MAKKKNPDFQKVKFKVGRTLKKNTNITDTSFKAKKIFIREKEKSKTEPTTHRKLNVKELLIRLRHHNPSARIEALTGLSELLSEHPEIVISSLSLLIEKISEMIIDNDDTVRKTALKTLEVVFKYSTSDHMTPFFNTLKSYLNCSATHIITSIHNDSLSFLDMLLNYFPSLTTKTCSKVLENLMDLTIKNSSKALTKKKTGILLSLEKFLEITLNVEIDHSKNELKLSHSDFLESSHNPVYRNGCMNSYIMDKFNLHPNLTVSSEIESIIGNPICGVNFLTITKNFLLEFLNDCKSSSLLYSSDKLNKLTITLQVMQHVMNILISLQICAETSDLKNGTTKMMETFYSLFQCKDLLKFFSFFPFIAQNQFSYSSKHKENQYVYFNLCVCNAFVVTFPETSLETKKYYEKVIKYISKSLNDNEISGAALTSKIVKIMKNLTNNSNIDKALLEELFCTLYNTQKSWNLGRNDRNIVMKYFGELTQDNCSYFINSSVFENWMKSILQELSDFIQKDPSLPTIFFIIKNANTLALRGLSLFLEELQQSYSRILDIFTTICKNFPNEDGLHRCIVELISFIPKLTREILIELANVLIKSYIPIKPVLYLIEFLHNRILKSNCNFDIGLFVSFLLGLVLGILKKDVSDLYEEYLKNEKLLQLRNMLPLSEISFVIIPSDKNIWCRHMTLVEKISDMILLYHDIEDFPKYIQNFIHVTLTKYPCFPTYSSASILILQKKLSERFPGSIANQNLTIMMSLSLLFHSIAAVNSKYYNETENESVFRIVCQFLSELNLSSKLCNFIWDYVKVTTIQQATILGAVFLLLLKNQLIKLEELILIENILSDLQLRFPQIINKTWWRELNYYIKVFKGPTSSKLIN